jgi:hypothetical protein
MTLKKWMIFDTNIDSIISYFFDRSCKCGFMLIFGFVRLDLPALTYS